MHAAVRAPVEDRVLETEEPADPERDAWLDERHAEDIAAIDAVGDAAFATLLALAGAA